jgi:transposase
MASRLFAKLSRIRSIAPVNPKTSVPRCSAYAYVHLAVTTGEAHDNRLAVKLLSRLESGAMLLADRGYDADWIRTLVHQHGAWANIPPKRNRKEALCFSPYLYRARNLVERFFNKIKQCRRVATR